MQTTLTTVLENPLVEKDITELEQKINEFKAGTLDAEKFRSLRLARGVYGQRQQGVQMIRIKLPFGKISVKQLLRIADVADEYSNGNLHLTTRQDVQIYYVSLDKTPELWTKLEQEGITLRGACGNTVRNVTASAIAGIDPDEPFDVSPYAEQVFRYFLRNPACQELGRKFKIAFSSSEADTAFTFMHDIGFIPKLKFANEIEIRGFKVLLGGGLGAQPYLAQTAHEFLEEEKIIPFTEAVLRVYDRYGERTNRHKARLKFLINKTGLDEFLRLVALETKSLQTQRFKIISNGFFVIPKSLSENFTTWKVSDHPKYNAWLKTNVFEQKQKEYFAVSIKLPLGNIGTKKARELAPIVQRYAADDIRITVNQGFLLKYIPKKALPALFRELDNLRLAEPGFDTAAHITSCPGTDTCNLGIASSTGITRELEKVIREEYPDLIYNKDIKIKISGCMNACGQHALAQIGFHGSSFKAGNYIAPALQLLLGGGATGDGTGRLSEKIIKIPSKRGPAALRTILDDYEKLSLERETFNQYFDRQGKDYFYRLLKHHADISTLIPEEFIDWGQEGKFQLAVGTGECAGVMIDLVATLLTDAEEKSEWSYEALQNEMFADSIYHSYAVFIHTAKAMLTKKQVHCNTQIGIIHDFDKHFVATKEFDMDISFQELVLQINRLEPSKQFAEKYFYEAKNFLNQWKQKL